MFAGSLAADGGSKFMSIYSSSKAALMSMVLPMARDLGRYGIRVNAIAPSTFVTPMSKNFPEKSRLRLIKEISFGRLGEAEEVAHLI